MMTRQAAISLVLILGWFTLGISQIITSREFMIGLSSYTISGLFLIWERDMLKKRRILKEVRKHDNNE